MGKSAWPCILAASLVMFNIPIPAAAWSNGGYSADPEHPDYGTHDYLAETAMRWLPLNESAFLKDNLAAYLFGTELPDDGSGPEGIGDTVKHHVYYRANGTLQDNASAHRALAEFGNARANLTAHNYTGAAKRAGVMAHYLVDVAVFGHVMGASTDWGTEAHHSDYENNVTAQMTTNTSAMYNGYMVFDGSLDIISPYDATLAVARNSTFGDGARIMNCTWMDSNYNWTYTDFENSTGASLNMSANLLADVLHTLAVFSGYGAQDTTAPTVSILAPLNGTTLDHTVVNISGTASDDGAVQKVEVSRDGLSWNLCTGTLSWSGMLVLPEGPNRIYAKGTDNSGNFNITDVSVNVSIPDVTAPNILITYPANGTHLYDPNVTVAGTASDDIGLSVVELSRDGASWTPASGTSSWSGNLNSVLGQNTIFARATDSSGNRNGTQVTVFIEDTTTPVVEINYPLKGAVLTSRNVTVTGNAWDDAGIASVEIGTNNLTWTPCQGNASWSGNLSLVEGQNTIYARAIDTFDNRNYSSVEVMVNTTDLTPPRISIVSPPDGAQLGNPAVSLSGAASDDRAVAKVELSPDGSTWFICSGTNSWSGNLLLREGKNTIIARATDNSGNTNVTAIIVYIIMVDIISPTVIIASPADGSVLSAPGLVLAGTARDDRYVARVEAGLDNSSWILCVGVSPWSCSLILPEGKSTVFVKATDVAGNTATASISLTVSIPDTMAPVLSITGPANGSILKSREVTVSGTASDGRGLMRVELSSDGNNWVNCSGTGQWSASIKLKEGGNNIFVRATDTSGNNATATLTLTYRPEPKTEQWLLPCILVCAMTLAVVLVFLAIRSRGRRHHHKHHEGHGDGHHRDRHGHHDHEDHHGGRHDGAQRHGRHGRN